MTLPSTAARSVRSRAAVPTSLTYGLWFFGLGVYVPYFPIWLEARGFNAATIGILLAIPMVVRIIAIAPITQLGDRQLGARRTFLFLASGAAFAYLGLMLSSDFLTVALALAIIAMFTSPGVPVLDVLVLNGVARHGFDYGKIRFWGSLSWLAANLAGGALLGHLPPEVIPPLLAALAALSAIAGLALPRDGGPARHEDAAGATAPSLRLVCVFAIGIAFIQGAHAFMLGFSTLMWQRMGYSEPQIGFLWSIGIVIETIFFLWARTASRWLSPMPMILIGAAGGVLRWTAMGFEPTSAEAICLLQSSHFITFAAVHLATMNWLGRHAVNRATRSGWIASAISAGMAASTILSGQLYQAFGAAGFFAMALMSAVGFGCIALAAAIERRESPA
jgi:PPP family 3-phenylpropionic acid transporter